MQRVSELAGEKAEMSVRYEKLESIYRVTILLRDKEKKRYPTCSDGYKSFDCNNSCS